MQLQPAAVKCVVYAGSFGMRLLAVALPPGSASAGSHRDAAATATSASDLSSRCHRVAAAQPAAAGCDACEATRCQLLHRCGCVGCNNDGIQATYGHGSLAAVLQPAAALPSKASGFRTVMRHDLAARGRCPSLNVAILQRRSLKTQAAIAGNFLADVLAMDLSYDCAAAGFIGSEPFANGARAWHSPCARSMD